MEHFCCNSSRGHRGAVKRSLTRHTPLLDLVGPLLGVNDMAAGVADDVDVMITFVCLVMHGYAAKCAAKCPGNCPPISTVMSGIMPNNAMHKLAVV